MSGGNLISFAGWNVSLDWTDDEQRTLEQCMIRYAQLDPMHRYIRIASALPRKSVRDIALRARWTSQQHQVQRHPGLDASGIGIGSMTSKPMLPTNAQPLQYGLGSQHHGSVPRDGPPTIEGPISNLLDSNLAILNQFRANMAAFRVQENTQLLMQFRENILNILNLMESMGGVMSHMPQLPVRLNVDLANNFLPSRPAALSYDDLVMPPPPQPSLNAPGMVPLNSFAPGADQSHRSLSLAQYHGSGADGHPPFAQERPKSSFSDKLRTDLPQSAGLPSDVEADARNFNASVPSQALQIIKSLKEQNEALTNTAHQSERDHSEAQNGGVPLKNEHGIHA